MTETAPVKVERATLYCSFCGKSQHEVKKLIAGPTVFICDECVGLCADIIAEETAIQEYQKRLKRDGYIIVPKNLLDDNKIVWPPAKSASENTQD